MTTETTLTIEAERVRESLTDMIAQIEIEGGDIRAFTAALTAAAIELQIEVFGPEGLQRALARLAQHHAPEAGAGRA
ncbi:hypothetical protein [Roseovarius sp.]|uniref:hypothetical protein n=1 Tax=Roseovarius sp. TaxID=1486281 RepID=UPI003563520A